MRQGREEEAPKSQESFVPGPALGSGVEGFLVI